MKRALLERNIVVILFIMVLVTFSLAQRDTERVKHLYTAVDTKAGKLAFTKKGQAVLGSDTSQIIYR